MPEQTANPSPTTLRSLARQYLREDNLHVWLPLCIAVPYFALFSGTRDSVVWRRLHPPVIPGSKRTINDTLVVPLETGVATWAITYWLVRQRQARVEQETDEAFATIRRAHAIATQAATRDRTQALVSVFSSGSIGTATDLAGSSPSSEDSSFSISEGICMTVAKLWVCPSSVAAMRAALEGDLRAHGGGPHDIDVTTLYLGGTLEWRAHQWIVGLGFLFAVLDTTWPAFTRRVRPRYLPAGVLVGLIGMNSLLQFQHCWLPFHVRNRHAVAAVLRDRFRLKGDAVSVQD